MKPYHFRYSAAAGPGAPVDRLVIFAAGRHFDASRVIELVNDEVSGRLAPDELVIVARQSVAAEIREAKHERAIANIVRRLGTRASATVVGFDDVGGERSRTVLKDTNVASTAVLADIWRRGGTEIFKRRGGFVESTASFHFANPSGKHTNRFIRLSNMLVSHAEIEFVAAATLHLIAPTVRHVHIDTPSLFTVIASLNDIRASEAGSPSLTSDSFRSYDGADTETFDEPDAAILISASSSGSLARKLVERGLAPTDIAHVLFLGHRTAATRIAIDLMLDPESNPEGLQPDRVEHPSGACRMCTTGSQAVPLRGDQFDIAGPQPVPLLIRMEDAPPTLRAVMSVHAATSAFRVGGVDSPPCQVIANRLFSTADGKERRDYLLDLNVPAVAAAVIVADEQSKDLATEVQGRVSGLDAVETFDQFESRVPGTGAAMAPIIVVQTVVGSGRRIVDVSRDLRRWPAAPIVYIAGFVATEGAVQLAALRANLEMTANSARHRLVVIDQLALPPRGEPNAWEAEAKLLDKAARTGRLDNDELVARLKHLAALPDGLSDEIFHRSPSGSVLTLSEGFVFWPPGLPSKTGISHADVFTTVSAVLQGLRAGGSKHPSTRLTTAWYYSTVLSPENFGRYNDGAIQASLLRAARPAELDYRDNPDASREAGRFVNRVLTSPGAARGEAAREFATALATGRLRLKREDQDRLLSVTSGDPVVDCLLKLAS